MSTSAVIARSTADHNPPQTLGGIAELDGLFKLALGFAIAMIHRTLTFQVLRAITNFLHQCGVGATRVVELNLPGHTVLAKLENENTTDSYKSRGAYLSVAIAQSSHATEIITASTGNHGAGVNKAAHLFDLPLTVFVPSNTPPLKLSRLGGPLTELRTIDGDFQSAKIAAEAEAEARGVPFIAPYDSYEAVCGQASIGIELASVPQGTFDAVVAPIGGGGLCAGIALALWAASLDVPVYGVCVSSARAAFDSFHNPMKERLTRPTVASIADGVLVESPGCIPWQIISSKVKDIVMVNDDDVATAIAELHRKGIRAEGAGALTVAAVMTDQIPAKRPMCIVSGGNIGDDALQQILKRAERYHG